MLNSVGFQSDISEKLISTSDFSTSQKGYKQYHQVKYDPKVHDRPIGHLFKSRMTYLDVVLQFTRPLFYVGIVYGMHAYLTSKHPEVPYPTLIGIVVMILWFYILKLFFEHGLGLQSLGTFDGLYTFDQSNNKVIIPAICYFEKFDGDTILTHMKNRSLQYKRLRSTFVKCLDQNYLKELDADTL